MYGGDGNDKLYGGGDDDYIVGDEGRDLLEGETGIDYLDGGYSNDTINRPCPIPMTLPFASMRLGALIITNPPSFYYCALTPPGIRATSATAVATAPLSECPTATLKS